MREQVALQAGCGRLFGGIGDRGRPGGAAEWGAWLARVRGASVWAQGEASSIYLVLT
jgi:hypothetical protein